LLRHSPAATNPVTPTVTAAMATRNNDDDDDDDDDDDGARVSE
jgi:hypothetical protein